MGEATPLGGAVPNWISEQDSEAIASPQPAPYSPPPLKYQMGDRIEAPYMDQFTGEEEVREGEVRGVEQDKLMVQFILRAGRWQGSQIQSVAHDAIDWAKVKIETLWGQFWHLVATSPDIPAVPPDDAGESDLLAAISTLRQSWNGLEQG